MRTRLFALTGVVFVGLSVLVIMALAGLARVRVGGPLYQTIRDNQEIRQKIALLRADLSEIRVLSVTAQYTADADERKVLRRDANTLIESVDTQFAELLSTSRQDDPLSQALLSARQTWSEFLEANREIFASSPTSRGTPAGLVHQMQQLRLERFTDQIDSAIHNLALQAEELEEEASAGVRTRVGSVLLGSLVLSGIVITLTLVIARSITVPLRRLATACTTLAGGDLSVRIEPRGGGELVHVASAFNTMADEVRSALQHSKAAENQLRRIYDSTSDGILLLDNEGRVLTANRRAGELLRFDHRRVAGATLSELVSGHSMSPDQRLRALRLLRSLLEHPGTERSGDLEIAVLGKTIHWTAAMAPNEDGSPAGIAVTFQDVSAERQAQHLRSDFVSFATHQLRTPLAGVKWLLELVVHDARLPEEARSYMEDAYAAAGRLIGMVNDLLDISRLEGGRLKVASVPVPIAEVTRSVVAELGPLAQNRGQRLEVAELDGAPAVLGDGQLVRQVVLNLTSNAIKYTPEGGEVTIRVRVNGDQIRWEIRDTGIGIPAAAQARLFEKFYRADNATILDTEGTGLGLYLVRLVVERLGGRVWCESVEGHGSTFSFSLPLAKQAPT